MPSPDDIPQFLYGNRKTYYFNLYWLSTVVIWLILPVAYA